ncbi:MAG: hypothetical protein E7345_02380 [Clostridiales bacterium]|nr:hypothetical protein [Clostridiales bacterium]
MTRGKRFAIILVSLLLVVALGFGVVFVVNKYLNKDNSVVELTDEEVIKAITATVDTLEDIGQDKTNLQTLRLAENRVEDITKEDAELMVTMVPIACISYVDYLVEANALKVGTLQYDEVTETDDTQQSYIYTLVTQNKGLVYVNVLYTRGDSNTYTAYEINYDFKSDELVDFNYVQFDDDMDDCYYPCYRYNIKEGKVYLFNLNINGVTSKQYQEDMSANKVNGEYISTNVSFIRCFEGNINDLTDYKGFDVSVDSNNDNSEHIDFSALTTDQQNTLLNCIANVKEYIIPYQATVDAFDLSTAEICDKISDANDYVNNKYTF